MTTEQSWLLLLEFLTVGIVTACVISHLFRIREEKQKYRVFAVRDKLLLLAATDKASENDLVFRVFYSASNSTIAKLKQLNLYTLVQASVEAKEALQNEKQERLLEAIRQAQPEVREVVHEFCSVMMDIAWSNSLFLRLTILIAKRCHGIAHDIRQRLSLPFPAYDAYRYFQSMVSA